MPNPRMIYYRGVLDSLRGHAERYGLNVTTVRDRVKRRGYSDPDFLFSPLKPIQYEWFADPSGRFDTIRGHAKRLGMTKEGFIRRFKAYKAGRMTYEAMFDPCVRRVTDPSWQKTLTHDGVTDTVAGWARRIGISYWSFRERINLEYGRKDAEARIFRPPRRRRGNVFLTYRGETHTLTEWANRIGMTLPGLTRRLKAGATPAQALAKVDWRDSHKCLKAQPSNGNHTRRKLAALGIFA